MHPQLNYMVARQRSTEVRRAVERARLATQVPARRPRLRVQNATSRPGADPGREAAAFEVERAIGGAR